MWSCCTFTEDSHNTGNFMPYSFRIVCGFFNVPRNCEHSRVVRRGLRFIVLILIAEEAVKMGQFLNNYSWKPHEIWFDKVECAVHGYGGAFSLVLMADKNSVGSEERARSQTHKHSPHTKLQYFHMTLGTVNQNSVPVHSAVEEINRVITPGKWHKTAVIVNRSVCKKWEGELKAGKHSKAYSLN